MKVISLETNVHFIGGGGEKVQFSLPSAILHTINILGVTPFFHFHIDIFYYQLVPKLRRRSGTNFGAITSLSP